MYTTLPIFSTIATFLGYPLYIGGNAGIGGIGGNSTLIKPVNKETWSGVRSLKLIQPYTVHTSK